MKKSIIISLSIICIIAVCVTCNSALQKKKAENTINEYKTFLYENAEQIRLRITSDSIDCKVVSDSEILEKWKDYFESAKFVYVGKAEASKQNGGYKTVDLIGGGKTLSFQFTESDNRINIIIDDSQFETECNLAFPFEESYDIGIADRMA